MTEQWFGASWGAPCCDPNDHVATPVGQSCMRCREPIRLGDQGLIHSVVHGVEAGEALVTREPMHVACYLRTIQKHGPECPHCRGKEPSEHAPDCRRFETGLCSCTPMPGAR